MAYESTNQTPAIFGAPMEEEEEKSSRPGIKRILRLYKYLWPYKWTFGLGLMFLGLSSVTMLAFPLLIGRIFDESSLERINELGLVLLGIFLLNAIFSFLRIYLFEYVSQKTLADMRVATFSNLVTLPMTFFNKRRVGELHSRISTDLSLLQSVFTTTSASFLRQAITIIGGVVMLSFISVQLTLFMLAIVPIIAIVAVVFGRYIRRLSKETQQKVADSNIIVEESLQGIQNVKAFTNESYERDRYGNVVSDIVKVAMRAAIYRGTFVSFIIFGLFGSIIGVIWYGLLLKEGGDISGGDLFSFVLYTVFVGGSIGGIAELYSQLVKAVGSTEHLAEIMEEKGEAIDFEANGGQPVLGHIEFNNVEFAYPTRSDIAVLNGLSFSIKEGQILGIVGPSGAGKSTIAGLIYRFYKASSGAITIDGKNIDEFDLTALRGSMAYVPQDVLLFGGSIRENILYGNPNASEEAVVQAAEQANAMEFISKFPEGLDTLVGERGVQLSGGQRQRIAIARAVLRNPKILILDEATSALDSESEKLVQDALHKLMKGRTSIVIAHRLSTIRNADHIIVMSHGTVVEEGTHQMLMGSSEGVYREMVTLQEV